MKHFHPLAATTRPAKFSPSPSPSPCPGWNLFSHNSERAAEFISRLRNHGRGKRESTSPSPSTPHSNRNIVEKTDIANEFSRRSQI